MLGTGDRIMFVQRVREALVKMGIQVDVQDTVFSYARVETDGRKMLRVCLICYRRRGGVLQLLY